MFHYLSMIFVILFFLILIGSIVGIIVGAVKLHKIPKDQREKRTVWLALVIICGVFLGLLIAALVFVFIIISNAVINGM